MFVYHPVPLPVTFHIVFDDNWVNDEETDDHNDAGGSDNGSNDDTSMLMILIMTLSCLFSRSWKNILSQTTKIFQNFLLILERDLVN